MSDKKGNFKRDMRPIDVWGLALGAIIGWGCFVLPGSAFLPKAGPLGTALGMLIGALLIIVIALSYGYLIRRYPLSGGEFIYTKEAIGKRNAFVCGWGMILAYWSLIPLNATALALISRFLFPGIVQVGHLYEIAGWSVYAGEVILASAFIILMAFINIRGIKQAAWLQTAISLTLVGCICLVTFLIMGKADFSNLTPGFPEGIHWWKGVFSIVAMAPWAFIGFDCIPQSAEEYNFSHKKSTGIMISAILVAAILYIAVCATTAAGLKPWQELLADRHNWPTGYVVRNTIGLAGLCTLGIAMFCAVVSGMNAFYISTSRLMYAMAQEGSLPKWFGVISPKYGTPKHAILFTMGASLFAPWFGREILIWIVDMTSVGAAIVFAYTTASAAIIAKKKNDTKQVAIGIVGCIFSLFFLSLLVIPGMPGYLSIQSRVVLLAWIAIGFAFYMMIRKSYIRPHKNTPLSGTERDNYLMNIEEVLGQKLMKKLPGFAVEFLKERIHQDEMNECILTSEHYRGAEFFDDALKYVNITYKVRGLENIDLDKKYVFACNHPLGGPEALIIGSIFYKIYGDGFKSISNKLLMYLKPLREFFVPVNVGKTNTSREVGDMINKTFQSDNQVLIFPAGVCAKKMKGKVTELPWKKTFVTQAKRHQRDIVPVHISGFNSKRYFFLSTLSRALKLKFNIGMLYLVDELFNKAGEEFVITIGTPISYTSLDKSKTDTEWAEEIKNTVKKLSEGNGCLPNM